ncbi:hypothetical protein L208DRAFT_1142259, partial [Tricholoma matsutake]
FDQSNHHNDRVKLGTTHNKGDWICPQCTTPTAEFNKLGHQQDMKGRITQSQSYLSSLVNRARDCIYCAGYTINATAVERMLRPMSLVPTANAFAERLGCFGFNPYPMLIVNLMHEFELGVWKAMFTHIIRVL